MFMTELAQEMGRRIRRLREDKGWTRAQLASYAGIAEMTINRLENRKTPPKVVYPETIVALAEALEVTTDYLLRGLLSENHD